MDAYYMYNFTGKPSLQGPGAPRQFDVAANSFSLNYAKLGVGVDTQYVAFRMDLGAGHMAALINGAGGLASASVPAGAPPTVPATLSASQYGNDFVVQQAFATVKPTAWLSVDAGRFVTTASAEVIEANKNWLYSRSMLFYGVPLLHTGVRVNTTVNPSLKLQASLVNGWNNDPDNNIGKTFGANATFAPPDSGLNASLTTYIGKEGPVPAVAGTVSGGDVTVLIDGVVTKDIGQASVGLNIDYLKAGTPYWIGAAASSSNPFDSVTSFFKSSTWRFVEYMFVFVLVVIWLSCAYWVYKDARRRIEDKVVIAVAVATGLLFGPAGALIYSIVRPPEYLDDIRERELEMRTMEQRLAEEQRCGFCRAPVRDDFLVCPNCEAQVADESTMLYNNVYR